MPVAEIARLLDEHPEQFSFVGQAELAFYLK
jgi:hypothetical protein